MDAREFDGRHVVVTGGAGALGTAVVSRLLEAGATCHLPVRGPALPARLERRGDARVHLAPGIDLSDEDAVVRFYENLPALWASLHLAGGFAMSAIDATARDDWLAMMSTNATSCLLCCREAVRAMRRCGGGGRIVNVAARPGIEPRQGSGMVAYAASKAAVAAITASLAEELAGEGIRVNAVAPSILDTPANRAAMPRADASRWVRLEAAAEAIVFLASPRDPAMRGGVLPLYGAV